eukprot:NODE_746_length_4249_cov_0.268916.p5 type:complete len:114 gc:universal NODE_746_length_4249_cov_0.268916:688-1029(+)
MQPNLISLEMTNNIIVSIDANFETFQYDLFDIVNMVYKVDQNNYCGLLFIESRFNWYRQQFCRNKENRKECLSKWQTVRNDRTIYDSFKNICDELWNEAATDQIKNMGLNVKE